MEGGIRGTIRDSIRTSMRGRKRRSLVRFCEQRNVALPPDSAMLTKPELIDWMIDNNLAMEPTRSTVAQDGGTRRLRIHVPKQGGKALPIAGIGIFSRDATARYSVRRNGGEPEGCTHHEGEGIHYIPVVDSSAQEAESPHTVVIEKVLPPQSEAPVMVPEAAPQKAGCCIM